MADFKQNVYIYGAGMYGMALYDYINARGIRIKKFIQTVSSAGKKYMDVPVISLSDYKTEAGIDDVILYAISSEAIKVFVESELMICGLYSEKNFIDCVKFIESNCLKKDTNYYFCTLCGNSIEAFLPGGIDSDVTVKHKIIGMGKRLKAVCPVCGSIDRYRWSMYVIRKHTRILYETCNVLHFAPEPGISELIKTNPKCNYITADIERNKGMIVADATDIPFKNDTFDYVIANHILEHISDDRAALIEIKRVLKPRGIALVSFPLCTDQPTIEDSKNISVQERIDRFGQKDHVRLYGTDYKERFEKIGFIVEEVTPKNELSRDDIERFGYLEEDIMIILKNKNIS